MELCKQSLEDLRERKTGVEGVLNFEKGQNSSGEIIKDMIENSISSQSILKDTCNNGVSDVLVLPDRTIPISKDRIGFVCYSGSRAYGTELPTSDIDIRGFALGTLDTILGLKSFKQYEDKKNDTVVYEFKKFISLLAQGNPNIIELLGNEPEDYLYISDMGYYLLQNKDLFLTKKIYTSFTGFAKSQMAASEHFLKLLSDGVDSEDLVVKYEKKINKFAMHSVRALLMGIDIFTKGEIITKRIKDHALLMSLRRGDFYTDKWLLLQDFKDYVVELENIFKKACENSGFPDKPDADKVNSLSIDIQLNTLKKYLGKEIKNGQEEI